MNIYRIICLFYLLNSWEVSCLFDPFSITLTAGLIAGYFGYNKLICSVTECCNDNYIDRNAQKLYSELNNKLYGQKHVLRPIFNAILAHLSRDNPRKALAMAFHGLPGTGKNYVTEMIRDTIYKKGLSSQYFHFFNGRSEFPLESEVHNYKEKLKRIIVEHLRNCPRSIFVFDEVDDMAEGVLDVLVPFLDFGSTSIWIDSAKTVVDSQYAIFIFLSNTGSQKIMDRVIELWNQGKSRDEINLADFEQLIAIGAFNEKGGFHKSDTISTNLIDHYIPFLPLEIEHVKLCIKEAFIMYGITPTDEQIESVIAFIPFGPEPYNLYAKSGCKIIENKVASIAYRRT